MERGKTRGKPRRGQRGCQSLTSLVPERGGNWLGRTDFDRPHNPDYRTYPTPPPAYDDIYRRTEKPVIDVGQYPGHRDPRGNYAHGPQYGQVPDYRGYYSSPNDGVHRPEIPCYPGPYPREGFLARYGYDNEEMSGYRDQRVSKDLPRRVAQSHGAGESKPNQGKQSQLNVESLVKELVMLRGHWTNSTTLGHLVQHPTKTVVKLIKKHPDIFGIMKNDVESDILVELKPKLLVCEQYVQNTGCRNSAECFHLHMCKFFAIGTCKRGPVCNYGHKWKTDHNNKVLKKFHLHEVNDEEVLGELAKKSAQGFIVPRICGFYNGSGCSKADMECNALHICHAYVYSNRLCKATCLLGHDIFARHCVRLLNKYGISTNEAARDIFQKLDPGPPPTPKGKKKPRKLGRGSKEEKSKSTPEVASETSESSEISSTSDDSSEDENEKSKKPQGNKVRGRNRVETKPQIVTPSKGQKKGGKDVNRNPKDKDRDKIKTPTLYSYNLCGDVAIPEICSYSLSGKCFNEKNGCSRLHSKSPVQWQVQVKGSWYNLRTFQGKVLETAYRDVNQDGVVLPSPDPSKVDKDTQVLVGLLGTSDLKVDFQEMMLQGSSDVNWAVRRLNSFSKTGDIKFFQWFFYDNNNWIKYGAIDSTGRKDLVSDITSDEIEKQYLKDDNQTLQFKNERFAYEINFKRMTQKNLQTKTERPIRRRPLIQRNIGTKDNNDDIPPNWEKMSDSETYMIVPITSPEERRSVLKMFKLTLPLADLVSIERVQSPFLLRAFMNKKKELSLKYNEEEINIQQLFHGTKPECIQDICKENFDWRLYGSSNGHAYGKGTYFSNSAAASCGYCSADQNSVKTLFIAQVIIGKVTVGNSSLTRPPMGFDTTVNSASAPNIFVKYDKQEYYPEYVIKFKN